MVNAVRSDGLRLRLFQVSRSDFQFAFTVSFFNNKKKTTFSTRGYNAPLHTHTRLWTAQHSASAPVHLIKQFGGNERDIYSDLF